ncbi:spermidine synthase [Tribolium castaneum]|uniref:Spermidine synthase n=1 Tax=Tribolium castaneum TaxID=7070 RepID=D2A5G2_TRICA|nr:PREDICTED: spermidine synthase [Tribolium castaneum]EFA05082.1 Spermidine synthase-like Protein [Tribolium castaneum]|eukprot:XP_966904.1 PREDICTED: spermidine synthase [Tribolium castaneum]
MDQIKNGWFSEINDLWPGQCMSLQVEEVLYHEKSDYQDVMVVKTKHHGRALILDGIIQCTEHDEFSYQEMISFLPLCAHPAPSNVLIVGGGDGGVARECHKHPLVKKIVQVEIDSKVVDASKRYLPFMATGFASDKLTLNICDGFKYMEQHKNAFDVIITDSSDPIGPAENLFTESYFKLLKGALKEGGVICSQNGTVWAGLDHVKQTMNHCKKFFDTVKYAVTSVPTYPSGQIGFVVAGGRSDLTVPQFRVGEKEVRELGLKYYNAEVHTAAFVLPNFVKKVLYE